MSDAPLSGTQYKLRAGRYAATIASIGATLRSLTHDGADVVVPFGADGLRPAMRGALLAPWPNRLADGRYAFDGEVHQLPINEVETNTASHGLVAWSDFVAVAQPESSLTLRGIVQPQPGYPWRVELDVSFVLSDDGLAQEVRATNLGQKPAPFGVGGHPYLNADSLGSAAIDVAALEIPADDVLFVSEDRLLPTERVSLDDRRARRLDFRLVRRLSGSVINHAYTTVRWDEHGRARALLVGVSRSVEVEWDRRCPWVQVYTSDLPGQVENRQAVAIEPMTCPPDAFNSGTDLSVLEPGVAVTAGWKIRVRPAR